MVARTETKMTEEQQARASDPASLRRALKVARSYAKKFPRIGDEFESAALVALCLAAAGYIPERGMNWNAYLDVRVRNAMRDTARGELPQGFRRPSRDGNGIGPKRYSTSITVASDNRDGVTTLGDTLVSEDLPVGWEIESLDEVRGLSRKLPPKYGQAIRLLYGHACASTHEKAGAAMRLCPTQITHIHVRSARLLAEAIA